MNFRPVIASIASAVPAVCRDALGLGGAGLVVYGVSLVHVPTAFVIAGVMSLGCAWLLSRGS